MPKQVTDLWNLPESRPVPCPLSLPALHSALRGGHRVAAPLQRPWRSAGRTSARAGEREGSLHGHVRLALSLFSSVSFFRGVSVYVDMVLVHREV